MRIYELQDRKPILPVLLKIWRDSVSSTHDFLSPGDIDEIEKYVPQALTDVAHLMIAEDDAGDIVGFMGVEGGRLEMLFLSPDERAKGFGRQLLQHAVTNYAVRELTVNEQNCRAAAFYEHMGFTVYRRSELDEQGNPYPILYMKLEG